MYLEELTHFLKTSGALEDDYPYIFSIVMIGSAEGWFHLVQEQINCYQDFCVKFMKNMPIDKVL